MSNKIKFNLRLEQYKLKELKDNDIKIENPNEKEYLDYIEQSDKEFFEKFDIQKLVKETESKAKNIRNIKTIPSKTLKTLVAAAACFIIALNIYPELTNSDKEIIYLKGSQKINIYLKDNNNIDKLKNMDKVYENNKLQITYTSKNKYGVIFSVDGLNNITFHYPEGEYSSTKLDIGKEVTLPTSYTLDNAPYFEKFYLITSKKSFNLKMVRTEILKILVSNGQIKEDIKLPEDYQIDSITLIKD